MNDLSFGIEKNGSNGIIKQIKWNKNRSYGIKTDHME
jgi:hypothetical protein